MAPKPPSSTDKANPFLEDVDKMSPQELADYLYALAEEIIASPRNIRLRWGSSSSISTISTI